MKICFSFQVPTYYKFITHPMDFSTIKKKIDRDEYVNLDQFENDFGLIVKNCHFFNEAKCKTKENRLTIVNYSFFLLAPFYKAATKLRDKVITN